VSESNWIISSENDIKDFLGISMEIFIPKKLKELTANVDLN
jgi:hypothetical protein